MLLNLSHLSPPMPDARHRTTQHRITQHRTIVGFWLTTLCLILTACNTTISVTPTPEVVIAAAGTTAEAANATAADAGVLTEIAPYPLDQTTGPVRVRIPEIGLDAPIIAMGWRVGMVNGERTTIWDVPLDEAGWHINSAGAGGAGNTVVSGRQVEGAAVFAPLALGGVAPGQQVLLTDGDGLVFVYEISEVTDPVPVTGATPDEISRAASYFAPSPTARLTLVTGWPEFTTTHRIFAVADFVGVMR